MDTILLEHHSSNLGVHHPGARSKFSGPGGEYRWVGGLTTDPWTTTVIPIRQADWTWVSGTWAALLGNVTDLQVKIEMITNTGCGLGETSGIDNVLLVALGPGTPYCYGDPGSGMPCPCSNDNDGSVPGSGCANGVFTSGAQLTASGIASVTNDTLVLTCTHMEPNNFGLYFQAQNQVNNGNGNIFGDGLRCAGADLIRLQMRQADAAGASSTTVPIAVTAGNVSPGDTKRYQCWYRNPSGSPCGSGFNLSNGYEIIWLP